jgi:RimJ/RimL family protein N-acetyltransferase
MRLYKCLGKTLFESGDYSIVPIRDEDKYIIMQMRNEQIYHLRQQYPLTKKAQELYFSTTIKDLFDQENPNQILFSFLQNNTCIGYGGLVHINWVDKHAEISFIIKPELEAIYFHPCWVNFLKMLEDAAFNYLSFHKIFTYAFDIRPHLYVALEAAGFAREATLKEHCFFEEKYIDVLIHSKINYNGNF